MSVTVGALMGYSAVWLIIYAIITLYSRLILGMWDVADTWICNHRYQYIGLTFAILILLTVAFINRDVVIIQ